MRKTKQLATLCLGFSIITAAPLSAGPICCENDKPPSGYETYGPRVKKADCPTGYGYRTRKREKKNQAPNPTTNQDKGKNKKKTKMRFGSDFNF